MNSQEKVKVKEYGNRYTDYKNNCSTSDRRKYICESPPVLLGKSIYISCENYSRTFWKRIFFRRNQIIDDVDLYKQCLIKDIHNLPEVDKVDVTSLLKKPEDLENTEKKLKNKVSMAK